MAMKKLIASLCLLAFLASGAVQPAAGVTALTATQAAVSLDTGLIDISSPDVDLLAETNNGVILEVSLPAEAVRITTVHAGGSDFSKVSVEGWLAAGEPGSPALPVRLVNIGIPFGAEFSLETVPGKVQTIPLDAPVMPVETATATLPLPGEDAAPLPSLAYVTAANPEIYTSEAEQPGTLAEVTADGVLRQQRIIALSVRPVQYRPGTGELVFYQTLRIAVTFNQTAAVESRPAAAEPAVFENLLRSELINYETARAWRQAPVVEADPWTPPSPGWRVSLEEEGLYRLTYPELEIAGLPVDSLDPRTLKMYSMGTEMAIEVNGEDDGSFDPTDWVEFYGQGIESKYTAERVYWLAYGGADGLRVTQRPGTPGSGTTPPSFRNTVRLENNVIYNSVAPGDDDLERWLWGYAYPPSLPNWSISLSVSEPVSGTASLTVSMLGFLRHDINPDHHAEIWLNEQFLGEAWWDGVTWENLTVEVPAGVLVQGTNTVRVTAPNDTGIGYDVIYINSVTLEYDSGFAVTGDELQFGYETPGDWKFTLDGFSSDQVRIYDVSVPTDTVQITGFTVLPSGGGYAAEFEEQIAEPVEYLALNETEVRSVLSIDADTASNLQNPAIGADYIIISHADFMTEAETLRQFRQSQGMRALLVDVQDVYDEFGYGMSEAGAIHSFLEYASSVYQDPAPAYVVLVGDGHYDPKDYMGIGRTSFIPPYLANVDPWLVETAADNRYVTLAGADTLPDMMLGRLVVNTAEQAEAFIDKIIAYEMDLTPQDWQQHVFMVADDPDGLLNFPAFLDDVEDCCLPAPNLADKMYYSITVTSTVEARLAILEGFNSGKLIVNYAGHAGQTQWTDEDLFQTSDVALLDNAGKLPVILSMTCLDGYYHYPFTSATGLDSLAETITRIDQTGAVASWSASGLGIMSGHYFLSTGFYQSMFYEGDQILGQAASAGKLSLWGSGSNLDLIDTFLMFGDPAMKVHATPMPAPEWQLYLPILIMDEDQP